MKLDINNIKVGDQLSESVIKDGRTLIAKNKKLDQKLINLLKKFEISELEIHETPLVDISEISDDIKDKAKDYLDNRLLSKPETAFENEVYNLALDQAAIKLYKEENQNG
jgi:hypothetical protein